MGSRFITLEGCEGVGKSSVIQGLQAHLQAEGKPVVVTREPGGTKIADLIRGIFLFPPSEEVLKIKTEALLVCAARAQHIETLVRPQLQSGHWVLCDRFTDSTLVYQGFIGGISLEKLQELNAFATSGLTPDLTLLLDCEPEETIRRLAHRKGEASRFDKLQIEGHARIRAAYLDIAKMFPDRVVVIEAGGSKEDVLQAVFKATKERLG